MKHEGWDNQWKGDDDYLEIWLDQCLAQFWRVLKPAGSLYLFCGHRLASDTEIMMRERFQCAEPHYLGETVRTMERVQ